MPPQGSFITVQPLEHTAVDVGESHEAMGKASGRAGEIIKGFRNPIPFTVVLKSRSGGLLGAPEGGVMGRRLGKMMD